MTPVDDRRTAVAVRPERADERAAVLDVVRQAFEHAQAGEGDRVAELDRALAMACTGAGSLDAISLVAETGGAVVGQVRLTGAWVDAPSRLVEVWVLSPLAVLPTAQGRGIGSELVRAALAAGAEAGRGLVFLEGHPGFYPRLGFERASALGFTAPSVRIPDVAFQVARLPGYEGWMSGALVYPDVFWRHDAVGLR
ncbi:GNAT family N-acetyltransferase [Ruania alba]|uniref:GNAT family N-acetyltransferase n=1 Tax=Ruania alba TaxID=648782 RepID=UPI001FDF8996|nr:N-acetyltransferase [Ruania alba]